MFKKGGSWGKKKDLTLGTRIVTGIQLVVLNQLVNAKTMLQKILIKLNRFSKNYNKDSKKEINSQN